MPRDGKGDDPDNLIGHSAVELFIARTTALRSDFSSRAENLQAIAAICRHLDGIPLAIEFAAAQAATLGIRQVVSHLDDRLRLLTSSRRTALPRHQTLRATLDWSYELLPEPERRLLRRLAVFPAGFTLESAIAVANEPDVATAEFAGGISNLLSKSLLSTDESEDRWRLLETIRAYALEKLAESGEADQIARRHAGHLCALLAQAGSEWDQRPTSDWLASYSGEIDGIRAALDWAWSPDGDVEIGIALTVAAIPLWLEMWLLEECRGRAEQAMAILDKEGAEVDRRRMHLCVAVATTQAYAMYPARDTRSVWAAVLEIARKLGDAEYQLRALWGIWGTHVNRGELREGLAIAKQFSAFAADSSDANDRLVGDRLAGAVLHFLGDQSEARDHIERMLAAYSTPLRRSHAVRFQSDQRVTAQMYLARILWLQGCADQATRMVAANVADARLTRHPQSFCNALAGAACPVSLWSGDLAAAKRHTDALLDQTSGEVLEIWRAHGVCFEGELLVKLGDVSMGLQRLEAGVEQLVRSEFGQYLPAFMGVLAEACIAVGQGARARTLIEDAIARSERSEGRWCSPELLRIRGTIILRMNSADAATDAQQNFLESLDLARRQGALAWQLRSATSLSRLWREQGHTDNACRLLETVYARFSEGHGTADLKAARDLLRELSPERQ